MSRRAPGFLLLPLVAGAFVACAEDVASLREAPIYQAYAADRVYHCPVPFFYEAGGTTIVYEGADLVMREGGRAELTYYSRSGRGDDPINWASDTLRVVGGWERDGFELRFRFDEGFTRPAVMIGELVEEGRMLVAAPDGSQLEFVPIEQRPGGVPERCNA